MAISSGSRNYLTCRSAFYHHKTSLRNPTFPSLLFRSRQLLVTPHGPHCRPCEHQACGAAHSIIEQHSLHNCGALKPVKKQNLSKMLVLTTKSEAKHHNQKNERVEIHITVANNQIKSTTLLLPRSIVDGFTVSEKAALPKLFEKRVHRLPTSTVRVLTALVKVIASQAFRSTMTYDLTSQSQPPTEFSNMFSVLESGPQSSRTSTSSLLPLYNLEVNQQRSCRLPLMDRPTELRLLIAKSAFHHPNGLE
jgi:hypothetical protein